LAKPRCRFIERDPAYGPDPGGRIAFFEKLL
jgi:hypothetical protein